MKTILLLSTVVITSLCGAAQAQIPLDMPRPEKLLQIQQTPSNQRPFASDSSETIDVGGVTLRLGMAQNEDAFQRLAEEYDVRVFDVATGAFVAEADPVLAEIKRLPAAGADSSWAVMTKSDAPSETIAEVIFAQGRLSSVRKFWTGVGEADSEVGFAGVLYRAMTRFEQESKGPCSVTANSQQAPRGETRTVRITCGGQKHVDIDLLQSASGQESAGITEILGNYTGSQPMLLSAQTSASSTVTSQPSAGPGGSSATVEAAELTNPSSSYHSCGRTLV
jgi:hypothetical protein